MKTIYIGAIVASGVACSSYESISHRKNSGSTERGRAYSLAADLGEPAFGTCHLHTTIGTVRVPDFPHGWTDANTGTEVYTASNCAPWQKCPDTFFSDSLGEGESFDSITSETDTVVVCEDDPALTSPTPEPTPDVEASEEPTPTADDTSEEQATEEAVSDESTSDESTTDESTTDESTPDDSSDESDDSDFE